MPRLSILLPVRNAAATLPRALDSIRRQTCRDWELLAIDDASTDPTPATLDHYAQLDPRIRPTRLDPHRGIVAALHHGLALADAQFIGRMDADDTCREDRLQRQIETLVANVDLAGLACGVRLVGALGAGMGRYVEWVNGLLTPERMAAERFIESPLVHPTVVLRREVLERVGGYLDCGWPEDYDLWLRLWEGGWRLGKLGEVMYDWWDGAGRLTRVDGRYGSAAVWRLKCHYVARLPRVRECGVAICGGGPIARRCIDLLRAEGVVVRAVFDVAPARIGRDWRGVMVSGPAEFGMRERGAVLLSAVGVAGGRERVRALADAAGYREGEDFWCLC